MQSYGKINTECKCTILNKFFKEYIETSTSVLVRLTFLCLHGHAFTDFSQKSAYTFKCNEEFK